MAVSVDTVYQRVLALSNKEQRGYITPQEFNLLANQAQMGIFEEYFHHLNQYLRNPGNDSAYSDSVDYIEDKLSHFQMYNRVISSDAEDNFELPANYIPGGLYRLTEVRISNAAYDDVTCEQTTLKKYNQRRRATFSARSLDEHPTYIRISYGDSRQFLRIFHGDGAYSGNAKIDYLRQPLKVEWDYVVVNEKALYNANGSSNFDLHPSEETTLVYKILELGGVVINKPALASYAKTEVMEQSNTEKQ
jgi:hypothetical protein